LFSICSGRIGTSLDFIQDDKTYQFQRVDAEFRKSICFAKIWH